MIVNFYNYMTNTLHLHNEKRYDKQLLILTNFVFIYIFYILYNKKQNYYNYDSNNFNKLYYLLILIFFVSSIFHFMQCNHSHKPYTDVCSKIDVITCFSVSIFVLIFYYHKINLQIMLLFLLSIYLLNRWGSVTEYIYCHSMWHITIGIVIYLVLK